MTLWLRSILAKAPGADQILLPLVACIVNSCNTTLISWGSRAGLSDKTLTFLGSHSHAVNQANASVGPLPELNQVVVSVKARRFLPDVTRSGCWQEPSRPVSAASAVTSPPGGAERASVRSPG